MAPAQKWDKKYVWGVSGWLVFVLPRKQCLLVKTTNQQHPSVLIVVVVAVSGAVHHGGYLLHFLLTKSRTSSHRRYYSLNSLWKRIIEQNLALPTLYGNVLYAKIDFANSLWKRIIEQKLTFSII